MIDISKLCSKDLKTYAKGLALESKTYPKHMKRIEVPAHATNELIELWRSNRYLCEIFRIADDLERLSICRTYIDIHSKRWVDGLVWDDLQQIKSEVGRGECDAVEVYPRDQDIVNVANMRHLIVFKKTLLPFVWRARQQTCFEEEAGNEKKE